MSSPAQPGFPDQARKRTTLRVLGLLLLAAGLVVGFLGIRDFASGWGSTDLDDSSGLTGVLMIGGGGFLAVFGIALLNAGFLGSSARYAAGETMPVVRDSAAYLADGRAAGSPATGPYCRACGTRNDADARFCDSCGGSLG